MNGNKTESIVRTERLTILEVEEEKQFDKWKAFEERVNIYLSTTCNIGLPTSLADE